MTTSSLRTRLVGLAATLALIAFVVGVPLVLLAIRARPDLSAFSWSRLTARDDGTVALAVITIVAWVAWAVFAASVVLDIATRIRGVRTPRIPGLDVPQLGAHQLVAAAALLFVAVPTATALVPQPRAVAVAVAPPPPAHGSAASPIAPSVRPDAAPPAKPAHTAPEMRTEPYIVRRGESLWKIAEQRLGDGHQYKLLASLNPDLFDGGSDFIEPGAVIHVPVEEHYVVQPGDTLSKIAEDDLGDARDYPKIFEASRTTVQPDGNRLSNPDMIRPGWRLTIPMAQTGVHPWEAKHGSTGSAKPPTQAPGSRPTQSPAPVPVPTPSRTDTAASSATSPDLGNRAETEAAPAWVLPGLFAGGSLLAAALLIAVRSHRRTQLRYRRPGQVLAAPPTALRAVEKSAFVSGAPFVDALELLDRALRHLVASISEDGRAAPVLQTVALEHDRATVRFCDDARPSEPWTGAGKEWSVSLRAEVPEVDSIAPYPLLVSVGQDDAGRLILVNLEHLKAVSLIGDETRATALIRHMAADLALNPWSVLVETDAIGIGVELAQIDPLRLRCHASNDGCLERIAKELQASAEDARSEPDPFRVILANDQKEHAGLIDLLTTATTRLGAALIAVRRTPTSAVILRGSASDRSLGDGHVDVDDTAASTSPFLLSAEGRLRIECLDLDLIAAGLTPEEAAASADIVDLTRDSASHDAPHLVGARGWRTFTDQTGALRRDLTSARQQDAPGAESLLPGSTADYANVTPTTPEDVETLAPIVSAEVRRSVVDADPSLDEDLSMWFSDSCPLPQLVLFGPVTATAHGAAVPAVLKRRPYFVELLAYLALHPDGVTGAAVAEDFAISASRARTDLGYLREWLGSSPRSGEPHLPMATSSRAYNQTGMRAYQVEDVLVDIDLFRRLRARGQARGSEGMSDLSTALRLVGGLPFDHLRDRGWSWLLDGERLHETIGCAVVDTAHLVVIDALAGGDLVTARWAAETACRAAPYDDICRLDLVEVTRAEGHEEAAEKMLCDDIFNRTDDHLPPIDLPPRTGEVVRKQRRPSTPRPSSGR